MRLKCSKCQQMLPVERFSKSNKKRGYSYICKDCHNTYVREEWYVRNAEKQKKASAEWTKRNAAKALAQRYHCDVGVIEELLAFGKCQICGSADNLHIDHCHDTGIVRGILCRGCNYGLGNFQDDIDRLLAAVVYLNNDAGIEQRLAPLPHKQSRLK